MDRRIVHLDDASGNQSGAEVMITRAESNKVCDNDLFISAYARSSQPLVARRKDTVMKNERKNASLFVQVFVVAVLLFMAAPNLLAQSSSSSSSSSSVSSANAASAALRNNPATNFNPPPCDFQDFFYNNVGISTAGDGGSSTVAADGVDSPAAQRFGFFRQTGPPAIFPSQVNWVVDNTCTTRDTVRKNIRILATTAGYVDDGNGSPTDFISIIAFVTNQSFFETSFISNPNITSNPNLNTGINTPFAFPCVVPPPDPVQVALPIPGCVIIFNGNKQVTLPATEEAVASANAQQVGFGLNARNNGPEDPISGVSTGVGPLGVSGQGVGSGQGDDMQDIVSNFEAYPALKQRLPNGTFAPIPCGSLDISFNDPANVMANSAMPAGVLPSDNPPTTVCFPVNSIATPSLRQDWRFATNRNAVDGSDNNNVSASVFGNDPGGAGELANAGNTIVNNAPYGYFCDDLLGMWINTYFWFTQDPGVTGPCNNSPTAPYQTVGNVEGYNLDGTPIVKTANELNNVLEATGCAQEGKIDFSGNDGGAVWLICPAIADPTNGGIALDAFLDQVRQPNGVPLDPHFTINFFCLQFFGQFCSNLTTTQVNTAQSQGAAATSAAASAPAAATN
jgi:hypothetical protein